MVIPQKMKLLTLLLTFDFALLEKKKQGYNSTACEY